MSAPRLPAVDALRGWIMVLMALDHAALLLARVHPFELWNRPLPAYGGAGWFFTRWVTHLCAPGFFFLMGASMALLAGARMQAGWDAGRLRRFFLLRGALLVAISYVFEVAPSALMVRHGAPGMPVAPIVLGVLVALGLSMMLGGAMITLPARASVALGVLCVLAPDLVLPAMEAETVRHPLLLLLLAPGNSPLVMSLYPLAPWFGMAALGIAYGRMLRKNPQRALAAALPAGALLLLLFAAVRAGGGFGNLRVAEGGGWIAWLTVVKYPPSLAFTCLTLGLDLLLLRTFARMERRAAGFVRVLTVYGQAPLFFYIAHFWLFGLLSVVAFRDAAAPQWALYPLWLAGVAALYPLCRRFRDFKRSRPEVSLWRML